MAANTLRPTDSPRRANVPREVAPPVPEVLPEAAVVEAPAPEPVPAPEPAPVREKRPRKPAPEPVRPRSSWSLFSLLDRMTSVDGLFREGLPVRFLPHLLFIMALTLLYIGNTHYGNRMNRNIQRLKQETEDLRADYTTLKSDYMEASKQSEVARRVAAFGLVESSSPPFRITVPKGHLDAAELELMPVLTADTLAARAARDSAAAEQADVQTGRRRREASETGVDSGPEIIAPPQALDGDSAGAAAPVARPVAPPRAAPQKPKAKSLPAKPASGVKKSTARSNAKAKATLKAASRKAKPPVKQAVRSHSR
ncbi:FtsL-like putative cell division protein [Hymenobacter convexus]|uniref:FtsL-like putative cell division protein n=1 Tax=Hymenobacter sp. CA1UV-4 TaxID=3063782 RepID=UPI002713BFFC|nr:FtsL-like putative cell division protein [Hymenobacter sp. CA1UV-4]MDO7852067.1 FtsL-like putative cell division protein [Hymenobacter sp. CA1UV-4]